MPAETRSPGPSRSLEVLQDAVTAARRRVERERSEVAVRHRETAAGQLELLVALEHYADGLAAVGRPVPYQLRNELSLYRTLCRRS